MYIKKIFYEISFIKLNFSSILNIYINKIMMGKKNKIKYK